MQVEIRWETAARSVIRVTCSGVWNWADLDHASARWSEPSLRTVNFCIILDLRGITSFPSDLVLHLRDAAQLADQVEGLIVVITSSSAMITVFRLFVAMYAEIGKKFRLAASDEEAHRILGLTP